MRTTLVLVIMLLGLSLAFTAAGATPGRDYPSFLYELSQEEIDQFLAKAVEIIERMKKPDDPKFGVRWYTYASSTNDYNFRPEASIEIERHRNWAEIRLNPAMLRFVRNDDQLAAILAHEMSHTEQHMKEKYTREVNLMREEMLVADKGAIRRMIKAGFNPQALREVLLSLRKENGLIISPIFYAILNATGTHPDLGIRLTAIDAELMTQNKVALECGRGFGHKKSEYKNGLTVQC
ncbi:MAG: M48 family metalloprotease [Bdellovibrionota bacterium]